MKYFNSPLENDDEYAEAAILVDEYKRKTDATNRLPNFAKEEDPSNRFERDLSSLLNEYSKENESNTPDFVLAMFLLSCLEAFNKATKKRDEWYDVVLLPGSSHFEEGHYSLEPRSTLPDVVD